MTARILEATRGMSLVTANAAAYQAWRDAVRLRQASGSDSWAGFAAALGGGYHRYGFVVNCAKPGGGATLTRVLDASMDWRDRVCLVRCLPGKAAAADHSIFPGSGDDNEFSDPFTVGTGLGAWKLWYSNAGVASDTASGNGQLLAISDASHLLYARASDGALCFDFRDSSVYAIFSCGFSIFASDQTGERVTPTYTVGNPNPVDGDLVRPADLNWVQDHGLHDQFRGLVGDLVGLGSWPLGPITGGDPAKPEEYVVRNSLRRQPPTGGIFRYNSGSAIHGVVVALDTENDYRDRIVSVSARFAATDIRPGGADEANHNVTASYAQGTFYAGAGGVNHLLTLATNLSVKANTSGGLQISNFTGGTRYYTMMIEATPKLGPRS